MKCLICVVGDVVGGHERQILQITKNLLNKCEIEVICDSPVVTDYFKTNGVPATWHKFYIPGKFWKQYLSANEIVGKLKSIITGYPNIIISGGTIEACISLSRAAKIINNGINLFAYVPMMIFRSQSVPILGCVYDLILPFFVKNIDYIITVNNIQARLLKKYYSISCIVINNYVTYSPISLRDTGKRLVFCGRLDDKQKNVTGLIKLLDSKDNPYRELIVIGNGPDFNKIKKCSKSTKHLIVKLHGWVDNENINEVLGKNDLLIMNSRWEGEPLVVKEFKSFGISCVARDIPGFRGLVPNRMRFKNRYELMNILNRNYIATDAASSYPSDYSINLLSRRSNQIDRLRDLLI